MAISIHILISMVFFQVSKILSVSFCLLQFLENHKQLVEPKVNRRPAKAVNWSGRRKLGPFSVKQQSFEIFEGVQTLDMTRQVSIAAHQGSKFP